MEKSLTKNSIFYLIYNVLNVLFPFITGIYVTRVLLPTDIGLVETARNLAQYFVIFSFLGIPTYGLREVAKVRNNKDELNKLYSELMTINLISTTIFLVLYNLLIFNVQVYRENIIVFVVTGISIALNFINNTWLFEGMEKFDYISIRNLIFKCVSFILLLICVKSKDDYLAYAFITVIGTAGNYILNIVNSKKYVKYTFKDLNLKRHMKSIIYLVVVNLAIEIYSMVDITMLGLMCQKETVTYYSYGMKIQKILLQIVNTFTVVLVPRISLYYKDKRFGEFNDLLTKTISIILIISLPIIIGTDFVSNSLITKIYGETYIRSAEVIKILVITICVSPIGYLLGSRILLVTDHENKMIIAVGVGAIINIIGNASLIPKFQEIGAAVSSIVSEFVVAIAYIILSHKYFKLNYNNLKDTIYKVTIALIMMTIELYLISKIKCNVMIISTLQIALSVIIYFGILIILKEKVLYSFIIKLKNKRIKE